MQTVMKVLNLLCSIDADSTKAGIIASSIFGGVIVICAGWLIFKKLLLNRKYKHDIEYVKEYRRQLEEREKKQEQDKKAGLIQENF